MRGRYYHSRSPDQQCPQCNGSVARIKRRWLDRFISAVLVPVHRYRCEQLGCNWKGRLKVTQNLQPAQPILCHLTDDRLRRRQNPSPIVNGPRPHDS